MAVICCLITDLGLVVKVDQARVQSTSVVSNYDLPTNIDKLSKKSLPIRTYINLF